MFARACIVYVVKEVSSFRGLSQFICMARNRTRTRESFTIETGTNSCSRYNTFLKFYKNLQKVRKVVSK